MQMFHVENELKSNKRISKTAIKSNAKIFPIYNLKQHVLQQTYIQLIKMVSRQTRAKLTV